MSRLLGRHGLPAVWRRAGPAVRRRAARAPLARGTELSVPVSSVAHLLDSWTGRVAGVTASHHVTVLDPFVASDALDERTEAAVGEVLEDFEAFSYELVGVERFPDVLYLRPEPAEPFIGITEALWRRFPDYPPYGGQYEAIVPHVTVAFGREPRGLAEHLLERLPVRDTADRVRLMVQAADGSWSVGREFRLGGGHGALAPGRRDA